MHEEAVGEDTIPNEMVKYAAQPLRKELAKLFNKIIQEINVPTDWKRSITIEI